MYTWAWFLSCVTSTEWNITICRAGRAADGCTCKTYHSCLLGVISPMKSSSNETALKVMDIMEGNDDSNIWDNCHHFSTPLGHLLPQSAECLRFNLTSFFPASISSTSDDSEDQQYLRLKGQMRFIKQWDCFMYLGTPM